MNVLNSKGEALGRTNLRNILKSGAPAPQGPATQGVAMSPVRFTIRWHRIALLAAGFAFPAAAPAIAGCNSGSVADTALLSQTECRAYAPASEATAVGHFAKGYGYESSAFGYIATAKGEYSTAIGAQSAAYGRFSTALGWAAGISDPVEGATAVGYLAGRHEAGIYSTAIGASGPTAYSSGAQAKGAYGIALGGGNGAAKFSEKPLIGARANYFLSIALGTASIANSDFALALGFNAKAGSGVGPIGPIAIGPDAKATLTNATALGRFSAATAANTTALGSGSTANQNSSVALGSFSVASVANTVSIGNTNLRRRIVNVAPGIANSDVPTLGQVKNIATAAALEALANETTVKAVADTVSGDLQRELRQMRSLIERLQQEIAELKSQNTAALAK